MAVGRLQSPLYASEMSLLASNHFELHVHSLDQARGFYVDRLKLPLLQYTPAIQLLAVKAGEIRISIFADRTIEEVTAAAAAGGHLVLRTTNLEETVRTLGECGVALSGISEAPGFVRFVSTRDPSGNLIEIAQYLRDPLAAV
jgi:catechol 2,3-dioxygenase-like lactoylglutathione lyase family enzyme